MGAYRVTGAVEVFPQQGGWHYLRIPAWISEELGDLADRGLIAIRASVGESSWDTSLLPMGDGTHFVALNAALRKASRLDVGDLVTVDFSPRAR